MTVKIDTNWKYRNLQVIRMENRYLRIDILPELGANIYNLIYKPADRNLLWHNPRIPPRQVPMGISYDDNFHGGWDELYPNDAPGEFEGEVYPDHGELWCQEWDYQISECNEKECTLYLRVHGSVTASLMEKWITLREGENLIHVRHKLTNTGIKPLQFLWKLHPALEVNSHHRIDLPAGDVEVGPGLGRTRGEVGQIYTWPFLERDGERHDVRRVLQPESGVAEMHFATELREGWCALTDSQSKIGFGLSFDKEIFSTVWVFMTYGGWRNLNTVIIEPCTAYPHTLSEAKTRGRLATLARQSSLETHTLAVVYEGISSVGGIDSHGAVRPASETE